MPGETLLTYRPVAVVECLDRLDAGNEDGAVKRRRVLLESGRPITLEGGRANYRGCSWTERDYTFTVPLGKQPVEFSVNADPSDPYRNAYLTADRGGESWNYLSEEQPPKWVQRALGKVGIEGQLIEVEE